VGCGLGLYTGLLALICVLGLLGIGLSTLSLFRGGSEGASPLRSGHEVQVYELSAMRRSGLVGISERPNVFHDESRMRDGATACAMMDDRLVRVESESTGRGWSCRGQAEGKIQGWQLAYSEIESIEFTGDHFKDSVIIALGTDAEGQSIEIRCSFGPEEGSQRMMRQLEAESGL
jgi:hypothetical protein